MTPDKKQLILNLKWLYQNNPANYIIALQTHNLLNDPIRKKVEQ